MDLRVEDHPRPAEELRRLLNLQRAYDHEIRGDDYLAQDDLDSALREYTAAAALAPGAVTHVTARTPDERAALQRGPGAPRTR